DVVETEERQVALDSLCAVPVASVREVECRPRACVDALAIERAQERMVAEADLRATTGAIERERASVALSDDRIDETGRTRFGDREDPKRPLANRRAEATPAGNADRVEVRVDLDVEA